MAKNKQLTILYIVQGFPVLSETFVYNQIADMIDRGYNVSIHAAFPENPPYHKLISDYGLIEKTTFRSNINCNTLYLIKAIINLMSSSFSGSLNIIKYLFRCKVLKKFTFDKKLFLIGNEIRKRNTDIIHIHFGFNALEVAKLKNWGFFKNIKLITTFHGYDIHKESLSKDIYSELFDQGDIFTVNSDYSRKRAIEVGCPDNKIEKLPVGLNLSSFVPNKNKKESDSLRILFIGRLIELKAPHLVVEICYLLSKKGISFSCNIIGYGDLFDHLSQMIVNYGLTDNVKLLGGQTQDQIVEVMKQSDVFLFPGIYDKTGRAETQGLVIQEAQAMELPVLISNVGGMQEGIIDEETGFVIAENNIIGFAEKLEYLATNKDIREKMGKKGREYVACNFSLKSLGDSLENIYNR